MVFVGADGVVESGGIINMMGTYQIALVAKTMDKPVYVAAESYKVWQLLNQIYNFISGVAGRITFFLIAVCSIVSIESERHGACFETN